MRSLTITGFLTLLIAILMTLVSGSDVQPVDQKSDFQTAIVALELAQSTAEVLSAIGGDPGSPLRQGLKRGTWLDFAFLLSYSTLNALILLYLYGRRALSVGALYAGVLLSVLMAAGDIFENVQLLRILDFGVTDLETYSLSSLIFWTHLKWFALFAASALIGVGYARLGGRLYFFYGFCYCSTAMMGLLGLAFSGPLVELSALFLGLCWLISTIAHFRLT